MEVCKKQKKNAKYDKNHVKKGLFRLKLHLFSAI